MSNFTINLVSWLARKDVRRLFQSEKESPYVAISLTGAISGDDGLLAYVVLPEEGDTEEEAAIKWGTLPLPADAIPLIRVDLLEYGFEKAGSNVLRGVGRYFEKRDTRYYGVRVVESEGEADDEGNPTVVESLELKSCWTKDSKGFHGNGAALPHHDPHGQSLVPQVQAQIFSVVNRMNANKPQQDQRVGIWNSDVNQPTLYGKFVQQRQRDNDTRKGYKK